jgi:hypothetical protein
MTESREDIDVISEDGWSELLTWLPEGIEEKMRDTGAFTRSRTIKQPTDLLRIVLAYPVLNKSLPNLSRWASEKGIADLSFISIWERMQEMVIFLRWLVGDMLSQIVLPVESGLVLAPLDATTFSLPGSNKRDWLVHMVWMQGQLVTIRLSKARGERTGESLKHLDNAPQNAVIMGDRVYGTPTGLTHALKKGMRYIVRFSWNHLPLFETAECTTPIAPEQQLSSMTCGEIREFSAWVKSNNEAFPCRIVVVKKDKQSAEKALRHCIYESIRKGHTPKKITLFMAQFITLATNLSETDVTKESVTEAYRWRWQIEREFRRFKSTTYIRKLVNQKDTTVEVYLLAAMVAWLLAHRIAQQKTFFPWGYPLRKGYRTGNA